MLHVLMLVRDSGTNEDSVHGTRDPLVHVVLVTTGQRVVLLQFRSLVCEAYVP